MSTHEHNVLKRRAERTAFHAATPLAQAEILDQHRQKGSEGGAHAGTRHLSSARSAIGRREGRDADASHDNWVAKLP